MVARGSGYFGEIGPSRRVCCSGLGEWRLTYLPFSVEGISVKMFLRGRPITMYIPSGIRSLEELPSGPPPETLSLDWVYPIQFHGNHTFPPWVPLPSLQFLSVLGGGEKSCESSRTTPTWMDGNAKWELCRFHVPFFLFLPFIWSFP